MRRCAVTTYSHTHYRSREVPVRYRMRKWLPAWQDDAGPGKAAVQRQATFNLADVQRQFQVPKGSYSTIRPGHAKQPVGTVLPHPNRPPCRRRFHWFVTPNGRGRHASASAEQSLSCCLILGIREVAAHKRDNPGLVGQRPCFSPAAARHTKTE